MNILWIIILKFLIKSVLTSQNSFFNEYYFTAVLTIKPNKAGYNFAILHKKQAIAV